MNLSFQKERINEYCAAKGYKVTKVVIERGSGLNDRRVKLESLLLDSSINLIVAEHQDRLARFTARLYGQRRSKRNTEKLIKELSK